MKSLLICPARREPVSALARRQPLALIPCLGRTLLEHTLTALAEAGATQVRILASDRPAEVRAVIGQGEAWGLQVEIVPEANELSVPEARAKYRVGEDGAWLAAPLDVVVLDHLPQLPGLALWRSYSGWLDTLQEFLPRAAVARVGMREVAPQVWVGLRSRVAPSAKLQGPVWIGARVWIGSHATIGPRTIIEDTSYVDEGATVTGSVVGPRSYVGALTEVRDSLAWGADLLNLKNGSFIEVPDPFLLGDASARTSPAGSSLFGRFLALLALCVSSPLLLVAWLRNLGSHRPLLIRHSAVRSGAMSMRDAREVIHDWELAAFRGLARRWPQLWNVDRGQFAWVGNRPLSPDEVGQLKTEFERLWLAVPTGLISLADAMGCQERFDDEARAHASFFAVDPSPRKQARVLSQLFSTRLNRPSG